MKDTDEFKREIYRLISRGKRGSVMLLESGLELDFRPATNGRPKDRLYIRKRGHWPPYEAVRYAVAEALPWALSTYHFLKDYGFTPISVNKTYYKPDTYSPPLTQPGRRVRNSEKVYRHSACLSWPPIAKADPKRGTQ